MKWRAHFAALFALAVVARAQEPAPSRPGLSELFGAAAREHLADPALAGRVGENLAAGRFARLLEDLHLQFKGFERTQNSDLALGFSFDFAKTRLLADDSGAQALDFVASGNVAFEQADNPQDFLTTALRLRWFGTHALGSPDETRADRAEKLPDPRLEDLAAFDPERFAELSAYAEHESAPERIRADPAFQALAGAYFESLERELPPEVIWDADLHAGLESNQNYSSRQVLLGSALSARFVSWDQDARSSRLNAFDFPAAALRWLAGQDEGFHPSGQAYPTIVAGLDVVDAARDDTRSALTDDRSFLRARLEARLRSQVLEFEDQALFLSAGWRLYQEIDAPGAVRNAGTDGFDQLELSLDLPWGWSLSYAAGQLPLDSTYDSTFALGFNLHL